METVAAGATTLLCGAPVPAGASASEWPDGSILRANGGGRGVSDDGIPIAVRGGAR